MGKWTSESITLIPVTIDTNAYNQRLDEVAQKLYEYFLECQLPIGDESNQTDQPIPVSNTNQEVGA